MSGLSFLCSYPKSGNTWLRAVLDEIKGRAGPFRLKPGLSTPIISLRSHFDELMGVDSADFIDAEIDKVRADYCRALASSADMPRIWKIHDCFHLPRPEFPPPFPAEALTSVVYIVRDPRDVAVSFAHHFNKPLDEAIASMADVRFSLLRSRTALGHQLPQFLSSWSNHVESWLDAPGIKLHLVRYEDMLGNAEDAFAAVLRFLGIEFDSAKLSQALSACRFDVLQSLEIEEGFGERPPGVEKFFRRGKAGGWRDSLSENQAERIVAAHGHVMQRLGYLP